MKLFFLLLLMLPILLSCEKDKISDNEFSTDAFPSEVGNWWRYKRVDMLSNYVDTIILRVVDLKIIGAKKEYKCYVEKSGEILDSATLTLGENIVKYASFNPNYSYFGDFNLTTPFAQSSLWTNLTDADTTKVISFTKEVMILGNPYDIYFLKRISSEPGYSLNQTISVAKNIGIVENNINIFLGAPLQRQNLQLIDYELK